MTTWVWVLSIIVIVVVVVVVIKRRKSGNSNVTMTAGPQCLARSCSTDDDCPNADPATLCFCNQNTKLCGKGDTCSSCVVSCLAGGDDKETCCQTICPQQSEVQDCGSSPLCQ